MQRQLNLVPGATVYGADREKVGTMQSFGEEYIVVEKGFFFPTDYYIPVSAITAASDEEVVLSVSKNEALNQGWDTQPTDNGAHRADDRQRQAKTGGATGNQNSAGGVPRERVDESRMRVPVHEEHLEANKHREAAGDVEITKRVVSEQETIEVPVTEERVRVDWKAPSGEAPEGQTFEEGSIEIPVSREEVDITKRTVQVGELEVTKEREQRTQKVTDSVRREVVDVNDSGARVEKATRGTRSNTGNNKQR